MNEQGVDLVFYDGECGFCDHIVQILLKVDKHKRFVFAPLQGQTAAVFLKTLPQELKNADSLIFIENYQTDQKKLYIYGQGVFRIAWKLGGWWKLLGWLSFLPPVLFNWGYFIVARNRHRIFPKDVCKLPDPEQRGRFLP